MKSPPLNAFGIAINFMILILFILVINFSFTNKIKESFIQERKLVMTASFYIMKIPKDTLFKYYDRAGVKKFKRIIIQFRAIENSATNQVECEMKGYIWKKSHAFASKWPIIVSYPIRNVVDIPLPFTLSNQEFRFINLKDFLDSFEDQINTFDYLKLEPLIDITDQDRNIKIKATAMKIDDTPIQIPFGLNTLAKDASIIFNPCPPDRPED